MNTYVPQLVAVAGPNGAGKSTFYATFLSPLGLRFVNADRLAKDFELDPYQAADIAETIRQALFVARESFVFETVFSDPNGDKLKFLEEAVASGFDVTLCYIGLNHVDLSQERVAMRVTQGGHDIPDDRLQARFPRTLENLRRAILSLPEVRIYDNSDLANSFCHVATFKQGTLEYAKGEFPSWLAQLFPG